MDSLNIMPTGQLMAVNDTIYQQKSARPLGIVAFERFSENFDNKVVTFFIFFLGMHCFKNVIFEKNHWAPSEDAEVAEVKRPQNSKR